MLPPDAIGSEVVTNCDGTAFALEPEECCVPVTLVRAAARDADSGIGEWRTCIGDHLKVRVFDEIHGHSTYAKKLASQSGARRCRHSPSLPPPRGGPQVLRVNLAGLYPGPPPAGATRRFAAVRLGVMASSQAARRTLRRWPGRPGAGRRR